jgi:SAM-dependent methyltransferase
VRRLNVSRGIEFDEQTSRKLEAVYLTPDVVAQRHHVHRRLGLTTGECVLDIGSGPGLLAYEMAAIVGSNGRVCGIDTSEDMLAISRERCAEEPWVEFRKADATRLLFADESFDAAVSTQVYEYVADVPAALGELYRVLRPGGRALVLDSDWDSVAIYTENEERMARVLSAWDEHFAHPRLPRTLGPDLRRAGFTIRGRDVVPLFNPEYRDDTYAKHTLEWIAGFVVGRQGVSEEDAAAWHAEFAELAEQGRFFFNLNRYVFVADRPGGHSGT